MKALTLYHAYAPRTAAVLAALCALAVFAYGTFLLMAVAHATHMANAESEIRSITRQLSAAESQYLAQSSAISPATATVLGLGKPAAVALVVVQKAAGLSINR